MNSIGITSSSGFVGANLMKYFQSTSFNFNPISRSQLNDIENHEIVYNAIWHINQNLIKAIARLGDK